MSPTKRLRAAGLDADVQGAPGYAGLCTLCRNDPTCESPRIPWWSPNYCERFQPRKTGPPVRRTARIVPSRTRIGTKDSRSQYKGLCLLCGLRDYCRYPKPEEGVWQCEEYE